MAVKAERLVFADALRVAVIVFVIVHHAAQAYGPTVGEPGRAEWAIHHRTVIEGLRAFCTVNAAFGLGLLFLLAGYFVPGSCERKGASRFLKERLARIGMPLAVFTLGVHLPLVYFSRSRPPIGEFVQWLYESGWLPLYWHLWFLGHLLLYSAAYAAWRRIAPRQGSSKPLPVPGNALILGFAAALALVTFVVRLRYPVDHWVPLFWVLAAEPAHLPQYVSLFAVGTLANRGDWLRRLPTRVGLTWLSVGLLAAAGAYVLSALGRWDALTAGGGPSLSSLARSVWEALLSVSLSIGLIVLFREFVRGPHRLLDGMARDSYAAYMLHLPVVVGLQAGAEGLDLPVGVLFALVAVVAVLLAFGVGHLAGKTPGLRVMLGMADVDREMYERQLARLRAEKSDRFEKLRAAEQQEDAKYLVTAQRVLELAKHARSLWEGRTNEERSEVLARLVCNPRLDGRTVRYDLRKPYDVLAKMRASNDWRPQGNGSPSELRKR